MRKQGVPVRIPEDEIVNAGILGVLWLSLMILIAVDATFFNCRILGPVSRFGRRFAAFLVFAAIIVYCSLLEFNRKRRLQRYLRRLKGVDSVEVHARFCGDAGIRWTTRVGLENEPPVNTLIAIVGDSFNKVEEISGSSTAAVDMEISWIQGSTSVRWSRKAGDATEAVKAVTGLCAPAIESIEVSSYGTSVRYRGVESFPDSWMAAPGSDVLSIDLLPFKQYVCVGEVGVTVRCTGCADLGSVPLKQVFEAISPIYRSREGVSIKLDEMDFVSCQIHLRVAAFGSYEDGLDSDAAAKVLAVVLGNRVLQGIELSTVWERAGSDHVRFDMKNGSVVGEGWPPKRGAAILAAAQQAASSSS
ncbi:hypothetical protein [Actinomyces naeslundii]|uniref:hypothetical protein n=1 Tax=Actinomyces naeslundii TaxID=1655 RepID=UPI002115E6C2|nr:hypothetical protein [Actinomyces naeslundii]